MNYAETLTQLEKQYKTQYARWSDLTWQNLTVAILPQFIEALKVQLNETEVSLLLESYLNLAAKAIARGSLFPHPSGLYPNFFILAFEKLLPKWLQQNNTLADRLALLASLWNLSESLSAQPAWLEALLIQELEEAAQFTDLLPALQSIENRVLQPTRAQLKTDIDLTELSYSNVTLSENRFFIPENIELLTPALLSVKGKTPQAPESSEKFFFVLIENDAKVFTSHQKLQFGPHTVDDDRAETLKRLVESIGLPPVAASVGHDFFAVIFEGSERLHLWRQIL